MTRPTLIKQNSYPQRSAPLTDLPFVVDVKIAPRKKKLSFWHVAPTDSYNRAHDVGRQYAADFAQYLKQNPNSVGFGMLGCIIDDMVKIGDDSDMKGYAAGFLAFVEQLLFAAANSTNHYALAETLAYREAIWAEAYDMLAKEGGK